ncbi:5-guanidino-2-oxopentanoate decarboxylase [Halolamina sp. CBA1230]|uniref:thiamine pyrophosphate-binding protein n=1 Tax=Halolamina sp. CBA1230 TaxID=1853690 RepID=UPI001301A22F|nr:5-guanidino-2-oxopentanoate decarboxylase [Halolamina sp. CBA1230]QKY19193.1 5-guanidino-2-oxopentanoate decarboxylase [Halolamina sp. CBA1230]
MERLTGGEAVVAQLEREGVDVAFGIPGVHTLEIYDALLDSGIDHVTTRHEQGAGFAADGYARATGRVGVCLVITGPGLTNVATAVGQAYSDSSPLLVISTTNATNEADRGKGHLHELKDQQGAMESIAAESHHVDRVADVPGVIADAFETFDRERPRPIHVQLPTDVLERAEPVELVDREPAAPPGPDTERVAEAVDLLVDAERPLLVVGGGTVDAADAVRTFVDETEIPTITTAAGKGVLPADHRCCVATALGHEPADAFVADRDLVLAVGTELSAQDTADTPFPDDLIHVDIDPTNVGNNHETALGIVGDAGTTLDALRERASERGLAFDGPAAAADAGPEPLSVDASDDRLHLLAVLREALADDAVVVNDMTKLCYTARTRFPTGAPRTFLFPRGFGTLGFSPPAAFGAAIGSDRQVVSLVGDGGSLFTIGDLATAVQYDLGVPIVVPNDDSYDILEDVQRQRYGRTMATDIENPDFVELAESFGAAARRIEFDAVADELPDALAAAFDRDRPTLIEVPVEF